MELFFSYSHRDEDLRDELEKHLSILRRQGIISTWHDRRIGPGREWAAAIDTHLTSADLILLLVSADFLASDYCYDVEMERALQRHELQEARVIPVILRDVDWKGTPFGKLQGLPTDARPVTSWPNRDEALANVARGIREAAEELQAAREVRGDKPVAQGLFNREQYRLPSTGYVQTRFPLTFTYVGTEARAVPGAIAKGDALVVCFQDAEISQTGVSVWLTVENRGQQACRWFGCKVTAYASPQYALLSPRLNDDGGHWIVDVYPGEQFTCFYYFAFESGVHGPKFLTCESWDKPLNFWWARGA